MPQQDDIEAQIKALEPTAPRVTLADLEANIVGTEIVKHVTAGGQVLRWAVLLTQNGGHAVGRPSVSVSPENDNEEMGLKVAIDNSRNELWPLMSYALKQKLWEEAQREEEIAYEAMDEGISFDDFVQYGRDCGAPLTADGVPYAFSYKLHNAVLYGAGCYLIGTRNVKFQRGCTLHVAGNGDIEVRVAPAVKVGDESKVITFEQLVQFGIDSGAPLTNGVAWSFVYKGLPVSHENDDCYLIGPFGVPLKRGQRLKTYAKVVLGGPLTNFDILD
jgi:hypothetical protein